jgi:hypothetical protein
MHTEPTTFSATILRKFFLQTLPSTIVSSSQCTIPSEICEGIPEKWLMLIPVMWALDSGDVGRRRSEATLVVFYSSQVAHMSQEKDR